MRKKVRVQITPDEMELHTKQGFALLGALLEDTPITRVGVIIFSTLVFNMNTWLLHKHVLKQPVTQVFEVQE